ncbi:MAG: hypothetical protein ACRDS1_12710, partial [Pseudonocardiaceae bacterium]
YSRRGNRHRGRTGHLTGQRSGCCVPPATDATAYGSQRPSHGTGLDTTVFAIPHLPQTPKLAHRSFADPTLWDALDLTVIADAITAEPSSRPRPGRWAGDGR